MADENSPSGESGETGRHARRTRVAPIIDVAVERTGAAGGPASEPTPEPEPAPSAPPPTAPVAPEQPTPPRRRGFGLAYAGLIGFFLAVVACLAILATGVLRQPNAPSTDAFAALERRLVALESSAARTGDSLAKLQTALAAGENNAPMAGLTARVERIETNVAAANPAAQLADLSNRLAALENTIKGVADKVATIAARPYGANATERAVRAVAIGTLRQAAEQGGAFASDLAMLAALGSDEEEVARLRPLAGKGVASRAALIDQFPSVADAILVATRPPDSNGGLFDRIENFARGLVTVRPTAPISGDTPEAVVSRMVAAVARGDLAGALAEREALPEAGKQASAAWAVAVNDRLTLDATIAKLMSSIASTSGG